MLLCLDVELKVGFFYFFYLYFCSIPVYNTGLNLSRSSETVATFLLTKQCKIELLLKLAVVLDREANRTVDSVFVTSKQGILRTTE